MSDEYMTPKYAWGNISQFIPNKIIWEPFYGDGTSGKHLQDLGFTVIHKNENFFVQNHGEIIVTNPPFSITKQILARLKMLNKPFILIMPISKINTDYMRRLFKNELQIIIPKKRISFMKHGKYVGRANFDCFYYCWKIGLNHDITWLS